MGNVRLAVIKVLTTLVDVILAWMPKVIMTTLERYGRTAASVVSIGMLLTGVPAVVLLLTLASILLLFGRRK